MTRQPGKSKTVHTSIMHNDRLVDALHTQASAAILHDPDVRAYYDQLRAREIGHNAALSQVGILHGCLKTTTLYDQTTAWSHRTQPVAAGHPTSWDVWPDAGHIGSTCGGLTMCSGRASR
ncbi:hypothetical protein [Micromonospora sp. NPDC005113]